MAHLIDLSNHRANMAYIGKTPWHGLGQNMPDNADLDQWRIAAGLNYQVNRSPVMFDNGNAIVQGEGDVLFRSDTGAMLAAVSERYNIVQPSQVVDFYRDLCEVNGFKMETMGALSGGKRVWALAKVGEGFSVGNHDRIENYLLLGTSYDKSMATRAMFTTVRVVCHNTLSMAVASKKAGISISHSTMFDADRVKLDLGIVTDANKEMQETFTALAARKVSDSDSVRWIANVLFGIDNDKDLEDAGTRKSNIIKGVFDLYKGNGMGSRMETAHGTAYGLLNAITEHVDHHAARNGNNRLNSAWFGQGDTLKQDAYKAALKLVA